MSLTHSLKPTILLSPSLSSLFPSSPSSSSSSSLVKVPTFAPNSSTHFHHQNNPVSSTISRRLFLPSVSGIWDAITGNNNNNSRDAVLAIRRGMSLFRQGDVLGSLAEFDKAIQLDPRQKAYLWQRGLSLYYLDRFEEGAEQFRFDVAQNPNDTEESIWCFLCEAQLYGVDEARKRYLEVGRDPRPVMREAYNMFKDGGDPEKLLQLVSEHDSWKALWMVSTECLTAAMEARMDAFRELVAAFSSGRQNDYFYASLYAGLYYESQNEVDAAKVHIVAACQSTYGQRSDDYMASLSKVHCLCRNWV